MIDDNMTYDVLETRREELAAKARELAAFKDRRVAVARNLFEQMSALDRRDAELATKRKELAEQIKAAHAEHVEATERLEATHAEHAQLHAVTKTLHEELARLVELHRAELHRITTLQQQTAEVVSWQNALERHAAKLHAELKSATPGTLAHPALNPIA
jgi:chromosome segregation ATPase